MMSNDRFCLSEQLVDAHPKLREWALVGVPATISIGDTEARTEHFVFEMAASSGKQPVETDKVVVGTYRYSLGQATITRLLTVSAETGALNRIAIGKSNVKDEEFVNSTPSAFERCMRRYLEILGDPIVRRLRRHDAIRIWRDFETFVNDTDPAVSRHMVSMWSEIVRDQIEANQD